MYTYNREYPKKKYISPPENINNESVQLNMSNFSRSNLLNTNYNNFNGVPIPSAQKKEMCKEHQEEVTYFCFECLNKCICSDCVVHGIHKNHDVMNIKKAYPIMVDKVN